LLLSSCAVYEYFEALTEPYQGSDSDSGCDCDSTCCS